MKDLTCYTCQLRHLSNKHVRDIALYGLAAAIVALNTVFLFLASIHCPKVMDIRGKVKS